jgi:hypothetical protein
VTMIAPACEEHAATSRRSFSLIPLTPFSHKGRRGSLGVLMEGLELRDEFKLELQRALATDEAGKTISAQEVAARLGLTW